MNTQQIKQMNLGKYLKVNRFKTIKIDYIIRTYYQNQNGMFAQEMYPYPHTYMHI